MNLVWLIPPMVVRFNDLFESNIYHSFSIFSPELFHDMLENLAGKKLSKFGRETLQRKFITPSLFLSRDAIIKRHSLSNCWQIL